MINELRIERSIDKEYAQDEESPLMDLRDVAKAITDFIFLETRLQRADILMVPGGKARQLIEEAAGLFHAGYAPRVLPSGGRNAFLGSVTEWEYLKSIGIELGIPETAILKEDRATNTYENALYSLRVLERRNVEIGSMIIVCKAFHARRAYLTYRSVFPEGVEIMVKPIVDDRNISRDNWFRDTAKCLKVLSEVEKIGRYLPELCNLLASNALAVSGNNDDVALAAQ